MDFRKSSLSEENSWGCPIEKQFTEAIKVDIHPN